jgi:hypothetical protein
VFFALTGHPAEPTQAAGSESDEIENQEEDAA